MGKSFPHAVFEYTIFFSSLLPQKYLRHEKKNIHGTKEKKIKNLYCTNIILFCRKYQIQSNVKLFMLPEIDSESFWLSVHSNSMWINPKRIYLIWLYKYKRSSVFYPREEKKIPRSSLLSMLSWAKWKINSDENNFF